MAWHSHRGDGGCTWSYALPVALEIRLLGTLEVVSPTGRLAAADFPTRKAKQVLQLLALAHGRTVSKDTLVDSLWRQKWPQNPTATVELAVSLMRSAFSKITDEKVVVTEPGGYRINTALATIDVMLFDELVARASRRSDHERLSLYREAVALVRGPLLEDETSSEWLQAERDRYRQRLENAKLELARLALANGEADFAHTVAEEAWVASDFVLEEAYAVGVAALVQLGRRTEARALLGRAERRLSDEEARPPSPALAGMRTLMDATTTAAVADVVVEVDAAFAAVADPIPFLGRRQLLVEVEGLIGRCLGDGHSGMLVVHGTPGMGKSRLLDEVVARHLAGGHVAKVQRLECLPSDVEHPMLAAGRLLRSVAQTARTRKHPVVDTEVASMFGRFADLLDGIGPVLLVIDDLHLADPSSIAVIRSLVASGGAAHLCVVASSRSTLPEVRLRRSELTALSALTKAELDELLVDDAFAETGGHPAILSVCCAAARGDGTARGAALDPVWDYIDDVGSLARPVLGAATGLSSTFTVADLGLVAHLGADVTHEVVRRAVALGLLKPTATKRFEFTSGVVRRVLAAEALEAPWS